MSAGGNPVPDQTVQVVPAGTYGPGTRTFPQRSIPNAVTAFRVSVETASRVVGVGITVETEVSYDGGATWLEYTATQAPADAVASPLSIMISGLPMVTGRLVRGSAQVTGGQLTTTGMTVDLWT